MSLRARARIRIDAFEEWKWQRRLNTDKDVQSTELTTAV